MSSITGLPFKKPRSSTRTRSAAGQRPKAPLLLVPSERCRRASPGVRLKRPSKSFSSIPIRKLSLFEEWMVSIEVSVDAPHLAHWLDDLKKGDKVRVAYQEALAIMVEPK
jgi:hypothetical protein